MKSVRGKKAINAIIFLIIFQCFPVEHNPYLNGRKGEGIDLLMEYSSPGYVYNPTFIALLIGKEMYTH